MKIIFLNMVPKKRSSLPPSNCLIKINGRSNDNPLSDKRKLDSNDPNPFINKKYRDYDKFILTITHTYYLKNQI